MGQQNDEPWAQLTTNIPAMLRRALRRYCARTGVRVSDFVAAVREKLTREGRHQRLNSRRRGVARRVTKKRRDMAVT